MCDKWKNEGFGIKDSIICIVTLFLAEYCGFGWVVSTFIWVFWFCFGIAWKTKFKAWWSLVLRRAAAPAAGAGALYRGLRRCAAEAKTNLKISDKKCEILTLNDATQPKTTLLCVWYRRLCQNYYQILSLTVFFMFLSLYNIIYVFQANIIYYEISWNRKVISLLKKWYYF